MAFITCRKPQATGILEPPCFDAGNFGPRTSRHISTATVLVIAALLVVVAVPPAGAQLRLPRTQEAVVLAAALPEDVSLGASVTDIQQPPFSLLPGDLHLRNAALIAGGAMLVGAYGMNKWWDDGFTGKFRSTDEGWFGQNTSSGGADKLGHAFFAYAGTRLLTRGFEAVGNQPDHAMKLGFWSALGVMTAIEVADSYSKRYRFSAQDTVMNLAGAGIGYVMESYPDLDRLIDLRFQYRPSAGSSYDPAGDYSGQTYLLVLKASGMASLRAHEPLRYFELAVGYGTRGYENPPGFARNRNVYIGISLNVSELLGQTVFRGDARKSTTQRATDLFFEFIQVPGTAALARRRL